MDLSINMTTPQTSINISYPPLLPVTKEIVNIKKIIRDNQVVIICGETGSGKTTQLPKILLEMGYGDSGIIGHTQPRRVAARSIANRIAHELNNYEVVSYKVRFSDKSSPHTKIKLMTDGILLQEIKNDILLRNYSALIIDEAHERSLNIDFILGYVKSILNKRSDLKVIITSATIENAKFSQFFNYAPILSVEGKTYPVDIVYQPYEDDDDDINLNNAIYKAIDSCLSIEFGNVLVFLPGEREIREAIHFLKKTNLKQYNILALYSRQNETEQNLVFKESNRLKIIITTNVAETSVTIPGIKYVIDSGLAKIKRYNMRTRVEQLLVEKISKASCKQRAGRAGRISHGMCIRLYSETDYNLRSEFTTPELLRSNLSNVILQLVGLRLGKPKEFLFLDKPEDKAYNDGFKILYQLQAIDEKEYITALGRALIQIPLDVGLARIIYAGCFEYGVGDDILIITSFLAILDPREYKAESPEKSKEIQKIWADKDSDFISIINLWHWYKDACMHKKTRAQLQKHLHIHCLNVTAMREWHELYNQLKEITQNLTKKYLNANNNLSISAISDISRIKTSISIFNQNYINIHKSILTGLINNIGQKDLVENYYLGTQGKKFRIHPSSLVNKPKWLVASNLTLTSQLYARTIAKIEPDWLVLITGHLVKCNYSNEHFDKKRGEVLSTQSTLLYGLVIERKKVPFAKINLELANEIFIKEGVINNNFAKSYLFIKHNQKILSELEALENKYRSSFVVIEDELFKFYQSVLPNNICDVRTFDKWCELNQDKLKINKTEFINKYLNNEESIVLFPDVIESNGIKIKVKYIFDTNNKDDGINAFIPIEELNLIRADDFLWLTSGLIREKINYIIKQLPKSIRIGLNPVNNFITNFLETADTNNNFNDELAQFINKMLKTSLSKLDIEKVELLPHLKVHFKIIDKHKEILTSDNLLTPRNLLAQQLEKIVSRVATYNEITNIIDWIPELEHLLEQTKFLVNAREIIGYNTLMLKDEIISYLTTDSYNKALQNTRRGIFNLVKLQLKDFIKFIKHKQFANFNQSLIYLNGIYSTKDDLLNDAIDFIIRMSGDFSNIPKTQAEFNSLINTIRQNMGSSTVLFANVLYKIAENLSQIKLKNNNSPLRDVIVLQLDDLIFTNFLRYVSYNNLQHFPRYLSAILYRLDKYSNNPIKDKSLENEISQIYDKWYNLIEDKEANHKPVSKELYDFKYKIEELRVSLFAPVLKTQYTVSSKRLLNELNTLGLE